MTQGASKIKGKQFSKEELQIIQDNPNSAFRVLLVTEPEELAMLRKESEPIDADFKSEEFSIFIDRLKKTLEKENGVGLAAPQVGIMKRVFLFVRTDQEGYPVQVAINPVIKNHPEETVCFQSDGCLSIPEISGNTVRYPWIDVEYTNENGDIINERLEGYSRRDNFVAVIFQHEFDHLNGTLFVDRLCPQEFEEDWGDE